MKMTRQDVERVAKDAMFGPTVLGAAEALLAEFTDENAFEQESARLFLFGNLVILATIETLNLHGHDVPSHEELVDFATEAITNAERHQRKDRIMAKAAAKVVGTTYDAADRTMVVLVAHIPSASYSRSVDPCAKRAFTAEAKRLGVWGGTMELRNVAYGTDKLGDDVLSEYYFGWK